ncbi:MAG: UDP-N-acetylenolpyruvoylglucosamine reductase, partial [Elusimicrobia bacterium]|nr:UDP-N-acetylenolpyruvoylglucosamine reductase [Elusimicrobiota bacterium]
MSTWQEDLRGLFPHARIDEPMSKHTTWHIGGPADAFVALHDEDQVTRLYSFAKGRGLP